MVTENAQTSAERTRWYMRSADDVLVIDDDPPTVEMIVEVLRDAGYAARLAIDGPEALAAIAVRLPALIVLDGTMRDDRTTLLERLCFPSQARVPIIVMSALPQIERYLPPLSIAAFLAKPFELDELLACVARFVPVSSPRYDR